MTPGLNKKFFLIYLVKFIGTFCLAYYGTLAVIGLSAPGGHYSSIVARYFDYVSWIRNSLLNGSKWFLSLFGFNTYIAGEYSLKLTNGLGIRMVYSCVGYGIMSFWIAFIAANKGSPQKKLLWIMGGLLSIWMINVIRLSLLLVSINRHWARPLGLDHHTWFNIASYILIFSLMYLFDRSSKTSPGPTNTGISVVSQKPSVKYEG